MGAASPVRRAKQEPGVGEILDHGADVNVPSYERPRGGFSVLYRQALFSAVNGQDE